MHFVPRRWQVMQMASAGDKKIHLTFLRLHSQQLRVPLRTFLRFAVGRPEGTGTLIIGWVHRVGCR
jgi:hypothetical protein